MACNYIFEKFDNIKQLLDTLDKRENNRIMRNEDASVSGDEYFTGTKSYDEAVDLFLHGYTDVLDEIKRNIRKNNKLMYQQQQKEIRRQINMPIGFIPNVPNALQNKPDAMINIINKVHKYKTLDIIYSMGGSCAEEASTFIKAGAALVSAINLIELSGIQTRLFVCFMPAATGSRSHPDELTLPILKIKDFGERFNLTKICFPLAHPSMFRRIGFKYLETCPSLTDSEYSCAYGHPVSLDTLKIGLNQYLVSNVINTKFIEEHDFNIEDIMYELGVLIKEKSNDDKT